MIGLHTASTSFCSIELLNLGQLVGVQPLNCFVTLIADGLAIVLRDLVLDLFVIQSSLHVEAVALESVLGRDPILLLFVICLEFLSIIDHALNLFLGQSALVVGNGNLVLLTSRLVGGRDVQDTISIDVEGNLNLRNTTGCRRDSGQVELAEVMVILGHGPLTLIHLDGDSWLVVAVGGEGLGLLGRDGGVPLDEGSHHTTGSLDTEGERSNVEQQQIRHSLGGVSSEDGSLHRSTVCYSLVRVDGLVDFLSVEEILEQLLDLGNPGGAH